MIKSENLNLFWASVIVEELLRCGVDLFCISPGSRSAPLTIAAARRAPDRTLIFPDERGAAFFALGYAKACGRPAALIATSGTAGANFYPAVIEAAAEFIPMVLLTADRPPELHDVGANQTIRQNTLYGDFVCRSFALPCPDERISPLYPVSTVDWALACPGPVHLNVPFREPLEPKAEPYDYPNREAFDRWAASGRPLTEYRISPPRIDEGTMDKIASLLQSSRTPMLVVGGSAFPRPQPRTAELIRRLQLPTHVDVSNPLRFAELGAPAADDVDLIAVPLLPDAVLHLGGPLLSKRLQLLLKKAAPSLYVHVHDLPARVDPEQLVTHRIIAPPEDVAAALLERLPAAAVAAVESCRQALLDELLPKESLNEPAVARLISRLLPPDHALFLSNSMPVRDMHLFAARTVERPVGCRRGVSGIDGIVASAAGFARGCGRPVTLLIGDLALLHDLNSLLLVARTPLPLIIVVINNDGGGIFSFLPIAEHKDLLRDYFQAPHGITFEKAAELFGLAYERPADLRAFEQAYRRAAARPASTLIEVAVNAEENIRLYKDIEAQVKRLGSRS